MAMAQSQNVISDQQDQEPKNPNALQQEWISILLNNIDDRLPEEELRMALKGCAISHYDGVNMDKIITPYKGKLEEFIQFLTTDWNWKIDYNKQTGVLIADENKNRCVCPMVNKEKGIKSAAICYCSEGFIEKMFSEVIGQQVKSRVLKSILRGDPACRYEVTLT